MKKLGLITIGFYIATWVLAGTAQAQTVSLREALDNEFVQVALCGLGASTGDSIILAIKSNVGRRLDVQVPSGTVLRSRDPGAQDMVIHRVKFKQTAETAKDIADACNDAARIEEERLQLDQNFLRQWQVANSILLPAYSTQLYLLSAYCLDIEKDNPGSDTRFSVSAELRVWYNPITWFRKVEGPETGRLFRYLEGNPTAFDLDAVQLATWAVTDNLSAQQIREEYEFDTADKLEACRLLRLSGIDPDAKRLCLQ